ncbi:hypothetical protein O3M35_007925 [Rhynocoris fuscipes]|uniref:Out at first protein BRICHOS-like domain-containing protein n=1 Tax=Rhynocoris fuscipes TaxID=488301 RepID=A0AAW1DGT9_9HEMI
MDMLVEVSRSSVISRHVHSLCTEASDATYTRRTDIDHWATLPSKSTFMYLPSI